MPSKSKQQAKLMYAAARGDVKLPGLSKAEAKEYNEGMTKKRWSKLKDYVGKKKS